MLVTRVEIEAPVTSFRYPHFLVGRQPSYEMPPPATLYGHLCSAVGEWVTPDDLAFGLRFTYAAKADDLEHQTIVARATGKLPGSALPKVTEGSVTPTRREFLFDARLTLYVTGDWCQAFRSPRYAVVLGRSQDLASYRSIAVVQLQPAPEAYYEHTLLPWRLRPAVVRARAETMARWVDYSRGRQAHFDRFLIVKERVRTTVPREWLRLSDGDAPHWIDPDSPVVDGLHRGVWLHRLQGANP
jgi:CRISPR-associated protein Cas5t